MIFGLFAVTGLESALAVSLVLRRHPGRNNPVEARPIAFKKYLRLVFVFIQKGFEFLNHFKMFPVEVLCFAQVFLKIV